MASKGTCRTEYFCLAGILIIPYMLSFDGCECITFVIPLTILVSLSWKLAMVDTITLRFLLRCRVSQPAYDPCCLSGHFAASL